MRFMPCVVALVTSVAEVSGVAAEQHEHSADHTAHATMPGREASGTSWQPDSTPMEMKHLRRGDWVLMPMAFVNFAYVEADARERGGTDLFASSMAMLMAQRPLPSGRLDLRAMLSLDPLLIGKRGYPLLFQTGETADGQAPLIDRQHPHDLFMELAASYSREFAANRSAFVYAGLPGEPALGPSTFMHRLSGIDNPEAPLAHHWLDSTHITFGVVTTGVVLDKVKLEASAFNGREPDEDRYDIEVRPLESWSTRFSWNPAANWSAQVSYGRLESPEQLEPGVDIERMTASVTYNRPAAPGNWQTTLAIGRNSKQPGASTDAWLLESAWSRPSGYTWFARGELVEKDELFDHDDPLHGRPFTVEKLTLGLVRDFPATWRGVFGFGAALNLHFIPNALQPSYGDDPTSWLAFVRWKPL
jgi:hypothetical protein